jgi:uncharacterized Zn finger protein
MPLPEPALPETRERRCPACRSERIAHVGGVVTIKGRIKVKHRCEACGTVFWLVRKPIV